MPWENLRMYYFLIYIYFLIYLLIFGYAGCCVRVFSRCGGRGPLSSRGARPSLTEHEL